MADSTISLDKLNDITLPHREAITKALAVTHAVVDTSGDPVIVDKLKALHATLAAGDKALADAINGDSKPRARPMDGGGGGSKQPPKDG